ncbi:MAG: hypothetical protein ACYTE8_09940 [Planctomycetota bacterium]
MCRDCEGGFMDKVRISGEAAKLLSDMKLLMDAEEEELGEIEGILVTYITDILGRVPRMARYVAG